MSGPPTNKPKPGQYYECTDVICPKNHCVQLVWMDELQLFAFACRECDTVSYTAAAYDNNNRVRICVIREREQ